MIRKIISDKDESGKIGWIYDRKSERWLTWEVDVTIRGKRIRQRGFNTEKKAKDFADDLKIKKKLNDFGIAPLEKLPTVDSLFARHLETIKHKKLHKDALKVFNAFLSLLEDNLTLNELKRAHFRAYADKRLSDKRKDGRAGSVKAETVTREMKYISAAINAASDYFPQAENWTPPKFYTPSSPKAQNARIIEDDEWQKLIDYLLRDKTDSESITEYTARRRVGLTFYFGLLTGLRHGEICGLKKKNFDAKKRRLLAERFKTKNSGIQWTTFEPLTDSHIWTLEEAAKLYPESLYFFSTQGKKHNKNYTVLRTAAAELKINYGRYSENGFVFHSTRHTFATTLDQSGIDRTTSRDFTAHTQDEMFSRYSHVTLNSKNRAMQTVESKFARQRTISLTLREIYEKVFDRGMDFETFEREITRNFMSTFGEDLR